MPNTILVPADFSPNSKAGIRFSLQLEKQGKRSLVFYHRMPYMKPTRWSDARYDAYVKEQKEDEGKRHWTATLGLTGTIFFRLLI